MTENTNFPDKDKASVLEIVAAWEGADKGEDLLLGLIKRLEIGQFNFQVPNEVQYSNESAERIFIGDNLIISSFSFLYTIRQLITQRCKWYLDKKQEYVPFDFDGLFKEFSAIKADLTISSGMEVGFWIRTEPKLKEMIFPFAESVDTNEYDAMQGLLVGKKSDELEVLDSLVFKENMSLILYLAKHLYISKETFYHWLRLRFHKRNDYGSALSKYDYKFPEYTGFWGSEWDGHPKSWDLEVDETYGLILAKAYKYYSDPSDWAKYEVALEKVEGLTFSDDKEEAYSKLEEIKLHLRERFVSLFEPSLPLLKAQGYTQSHEPQDISYIQLKTMLDANRLIVDDSRGWIGKVEFQQITILKANAPALKIEPVKANKYNLGTAETKTLFKLIAGMAKGGYKYDEAKERNEATADIVDDTGVDQKTVKKWVELAIEQTRDKSDS